MLYSGILIGVELRSPNWIWCLIWVNPNKAAGPDSIKPLILKELRLEIAPVICLLFEKTLKTDQLPSEWTKAQVCPLYKKGDKTDPANYRPISLTCIFCKWWSM